MLVNPSRTFGLLTIVVLLATGCATTKEEYRLFFPEPPDAPRVQYLHRFHSQEDIQVRSKFDEFVVGKAVSGRFGKPYGLFYRDGKIYVADGGFGVLIILDLEKREWHPVFSPGEGQLDKPIGVVVAEDGTIYVGDSGREQVVRYGDDEKYLGAWGKKGDFRPAGLALRGEYLYVADVRGHFIRVMDRHTGAIVRSIGGPPPEGVDNPPPGYLIAPVNVAVDDAGNVYASDAMLGEVMKYSPEGQYLMSFGGLGDAVGAFARPRGIAIDGERRLLTVDAAFENVQLFDPRGYPLMYFGGAGREPGRMWLPSGICANVPIHEFFKNKIADDFHAESLIIVANQYGPANVSVYAFGYRGDTPPAYRDPEEIRKELQEREKDFEETRPTEPEEKAAPDWLRPTD